MSGRPCVYCGDESTEIDHVIPASRGGCGELWNLAPACHRCNHEKSDMLVDEWRSAREARGESWPPLSFSMQVRQWVEELTAE